MNDSFGNDEKAGAGSSTGLSRRDFLRRATGAAACLLGFPTIIPATALGRDGKAAPSERVRFGLIGCGGMSRAAVAYEKDGRGEIVALADPDPRKLRGWMAGPLNGRAVRQYADFRELLESGVDAVHIATGDHWHVPILLRAARAGKHVFVQKPLGLSIEQDLACREVLNHHKVQVQYGTQQRASAHTRGPVELVLNGHIGEVRMAYVWAPQGLSGGVCEPGPVPEGMDYDLWLGPAPVAPYCKDRVEAARARKAIFHCYDYAIGFVAGWGAHPYDQLQWWLDEEGIGMPYAVEATGDIPSEGLFDTVTHWDALLHYPRGLEVRFCDNETIRRHLPVLEGFEPSSNGVLLIGTAGWIYTGRGIWAASSREMLARHKDPGPRRIVDAGPSHERNFLDAILGKNRVVSPLESAIRSDICCHFTDLAIRYGGRLEWDAKAETITGNPVARAAMRRPMRAPWTL
jgi:predicted dehydrogenase